MARDTDPYDSVKKAANLMSGFLLAALAEPNCSRALLRTDHRAFFTVYASLRANFGLQKPDQARNVTLNS